MVAAYLGIEPSGQTDTFQSVEEAAEFIPVATVSKDDFNAILRHHGLPAAE